VIGCLRSPTFRNSGFSPPTACNSGLSAATSVIGRSSAATDSSLGLRLDRDSIGFFNSWNLFTPSSLTLVDSLMTSLLALITAVLLLIASRFLFSTVVSEHAVLLMNKRGRTIRTAAPVITCILLKQNSSARTQGLEDNQQA